MLVCEVLLLNLWWVFFSFPCVSPSLNLTHPGTQRWARRGEALWFQSEDEKTEPLHSESTECPSSSLFLPQTLLPKSGSNPVVMVTVAAKGAHKKKTKSRRTFFSVGGSCNTKAVGPIPIIFIFSFSPLTISPQTWSKPWPDNWKVELMESRKSWEVIEVGSWRWDSLK